MHSVSLVSFLLCLVLVSGCATNGLISVQTNIPWNQSTITVVNNTIYPVDILVDGRPQGHLNPSGSLSLSYGNWSDSPAEFSIVAVAPDYPGHASYRTFVVDGRYRRSETWIIYL